MRDKTQTFARIRAVVAALVAVTVIVPGSVGALAAADPATEIRRALQRLPYYGVFDFLAFSVDRGIVTLTGYAYRGNLRHEAEAAVKRVAGVDEVANQIEELPASPNDDRIRWATFYRIYTDDFLSRYAPGGPMAARNELREAARFPGMQPFGVYPIHIVVKGGRTTLLGVVDSEADKTMVSFRAREVLQVLSVENDLMVDR